MSNKLNKVGSIAVLNAGAITGMRRKVAGT